MFVKNSLRSSFLEIVSYTIPQLYTGNCWYIGYTAFCPAEGKLKRVRIKLNHIKNARDRRQYAKDLIYRISRKLENGWNPFIEAENSKAYATFSDVCDRYQTYTTKLYNDKNLREKTLYGYLSMMRTLQVWNESRKVPITYIYQFDRMFITEFLNYIYIDKQKSIRTRNNYLTWLGIFDSFLVQHCYLKTKATEGIVSIRRNSAEKDRDIIEDRDLVRLKNFLEDNNKYFLLACYLLHYAMIRPKEMSYLKIESFSLSKQTIYIPGEVSKNKKSAYVTLPKKIIMLMLELDIFSSPGNYFLFSKNFKPGEEHVNERKMRDYWAKVIRANLRFPLRYKFYSLKDTGITAMIKTCDVLSTRDQARHSSILMTNTYTPQDIKAANDLLLNYEGVL